MNVKPKHLTPQATPRLALVSGVAPSNRTPVSIAGLAYAAGLWSAASAGQQHDLARHLGLGQQLVSRYGTGDRILPLGDVLASPPDVAAPVLRGALAYVDRHRTGAVDPTHEAVMVVADASQLIVSLRACPLEAMDEQSVRRAIRMVDSAMERLAEIRTKLSRVLERMRGGR